MSVLTCDDCRDLIDTDAEPESYNEIDDKWRCRNCRLLMVARANELTEKYGRVELGIDGDAAFALLGPDIQEGEAEFVKIPGWNPTQPSDIEPTLVVPTGLHGMKLRCCKIALERLRARLGVEWLHYYFGPSHPYGS